MGPSKTPTIGWRDKLGEARRESAVIRILLTDISYSDKTITLGDNAVANYAAYDGHCKISVLNIDYSSFIGYTMFRYMDICPL